MSSTDVSVLVADYWTLVDRYNREWRARLWDTNRELAGAAEDAYSAAIAAGWDGESRPGENGY